MFGLRGRLLCSHILGVYICWHFLDLYICPDFFEICTCQDFLDFYICYGILGVVSARASRAFILVRTLGALHMSNPFRLLHLSEYYIYTFVCTHMHDFVSVATSLITRTLAELHWKTKWIHTNTKHLCKMPSHSCNTQLQSVFAKHSCKTGLRKRYLLRAIPILPTSNEFEKAEATACCNANMCSPMWQISCLSVVAPKCLCKKSNVSFQENTVVLKVLVR